MTQQEKSKFRKTKKWQAFRKRLQYHYQKDYLTHKPLRAGWNAHHLCMKEEEYEQLGLDRLIPLNKQSHKFIHFVYTYYNKDPEVLDRLAEIMQRMKELNS